MKLEQVFEYSVDGRLEEDETLGGLRGDPTGKAEIQEEASSIRG